MTTHGETLSTITTPTKAVTAAPRLRELTYRYQPKHAPDGESRHSSTAMTSKPFTCCCRKLRVVSDNSPRRSRFRLKNLCLEQV